MPEATDNPAMAPALPAIEYATDHVDTDRWFQRQNVVLLQQLADALAYQRTHRPFTWQSLAWLGVVVALAFRSELWRSAVFVLFVMAFEYLRLRAWGSRAFARLTLCSGAVLLPCLYLLYFWDSGPLLWNLLPLAGFAGISLLATWWHWRTKLRVWEVQAETRVEPEMALLLDRIHAQVRARRVSEAAHFGYGFWRTTCRFSRVGEMLVADVGRPRWLNFALPEDVMVETLVTHPQHPRHIKLVLRWNDECLALHGEADALHLLARLRKEAHDAAVERTTRESETAPTPPGA